MENGHGRGGADIIVPVHNRFHQSRRLLEGLYRHSDLPFHIYLIDNGSTDETTDLAKIYTRSITVVRNREDTGWVAGVNQGIRLSESHNLVFMNNNVEVSQGWLGSLLAFLDTHPKIAAVGPLSSNAEYLQSVDWVREKMVPQIPHFLTSDLHERNRVLRYHFHRAGILVEGVLDFSCAAVKRRAVDAVGELSATAAGECDNGDYCRRLRKSGYVLGVALDTYVVRQSEEAPQEIFSGDLRREVRRTAAAR